jgi:hypothetical protein
LCQPRILLGWDQSKSAISRKSPDNC